MSWPFRLHQMATLWRKGPADGFGKFDFESPVLVQVRWQAQRQVVTDAEGREVVTDSVVYTDGASVVPSVGDFLALGDHTEPDGLPYGIPGAREVRSVAESPSLDATRSLVKSAV